MELNDIYNRFSSQIGKMCFNRYITKNIISKEIKAILKEGDLEEKYKAESFWYIHPINGDLINYHNVLVTKTEYLEILKYNKNKQYSWFIVSAYESYEEYISNVYSFMGFHDINFWKLCDFGNISLDELKQKDLNFFINQIRDNKKITTESILNSIRKKIIDFERYEKDNSLLLNLKVIIIIISQIRHIIVHNDGKLQNYDLFISNVFKKTGLSENSSEFLSYKKFIDLFINKTHDEIEILELVLNNYGGLEEQIDRIDTLIKPLTSHANLIYELCQKYIENVKA